MRPRSEGNSPQYCPMLVSQGKARACHNQTQKLPPPLTHQSGPLYIWKLCLSMCCSVSNDLSFPFLFFLLLSLFLVSSLCNGGLTDLKGCAYFYYHIKHFNLQCAH